MAVTAQPPDTYALKTRGLLAQLGKGRHGCSARHHAGRETNMAPPKDQDVQAGETEAVALSGIDFTEFNDAGLPTAAGIRFRLVTKVRDSFGRSQLSEMTVPQDNNLELIAALQAYAVVVKAWMGRLGVG